MEVLATAIQEKKERKRILPGNEKVKLSLFADDMILYIENPKETPDLLAHIGGFGSATGHKNIDICNILYNSNEILEREIKETIPCTITSKRIKYLEINLHRR